MATSSPLGVGNRPTYRAIFTIKQPEVHVLAVRRARQDALRAKDRILLATDGR